VFCQFIRPSQSVSRSDEETLLPITTIKAEGHLAWLFIIVMLCYTQAIRQSFFLSSTSCDVYSDNKRR